MVCVWLSLLRRHRLFVPFNTWDEDSVAILLLGIMAAIFTGIGGNSGFLKIFIKLLFTKLIIFSGYPDKKMTTSIILSIAISS